MSISRRTLLKQGAIAAAAQHAHGLKATPFSNLAEGRTIAPGPFRPEWGSLKRYKTPDWFRDAKFGIWAHWSAQCVPEAGDWYAREMYIQGHPQYDHHVKHYGHPSKTGFMEIDNLWKAEAWNPHELMQLYVNAGAKYFMRLANHHDNFDRYDSRFHAWNSTAWPGGDLFTIKTLTRGRPEYPRPVRQVELLGHEEPLEFKQNADGLSIRLPSTRPNPNAYAFRIR